MKLWLRQTLLTLLIILVAVSACLYVFVALQTDALLSAARQDGLLRLHAFAEHLATLDATGTVSYQADSATRTALIQYTFSVYAHILQNADSAYSLVMDGAYLYNISPLDAAALLPMPGNAVTGSLMLSFDGRDMLVSALNTRVLGADITLYLAQDTGSVSGGIANLSRTAQWTLAGCLALAGVVLPLTLLRTLKPLRRLTLVSERIAGGQYALRSRVDLPDEVGELSRSFDRMADTVEQKILTLEDAARRRELLLGALTHEMKTPMTAIIGFADSLLSMPLDEEKRGEAAKEIYDAAVRTEHLSQKMMQLIALTGGEAPLFRPVDAHELLSQAVKALQKQASDKGVTLSARADVAYIYGDGDLLFSLLTNLADNAIKASDRGGAVSLTARGQDGGACIAVTDAGAGIPEDKIALVTEPFYRVDKARSRLLGGAGLGLTLCQAIVNAHGGSLEIESKAGRGTTVRAVLPGHMPEDASDE